MIKNLLVTGGLGFIGSHTSIQIFEKTDMNIIIVDNLSNCFDDVYERMKTILSKSAKSTQVQERVQVHYISILDQKKLDELFEDKKQQGKPIDGIMHFAAKKAVRESVEKPLAYYQNNVVGSVNLLKMMEKYTCKNFVFSSTSALYGEKDDCRQTDVKNPLNPYSESKLCVELMLASLAKLHPDWRIISLRYFNPCGGHQSGLLGDEPTQYPNNLFPYIQQVLLGKRQKLTIFGNDYPTPDGTCIRDYIHIYDLAIAHVFALEDLKVIDKAYQVYNLGSEKGYSVLQVVQQYEKVLGRSFNWVMGGRRKGDGAKLIANSEKAHEKLGWKTVKTLEDMCRDSCRFVFTRYNIQHKLN